MRLSHALLAAAVSVAAGYGLAPSPSAAAQLQIGYTQGPLTLDPANHRDRLTESLLRTMYDGLVAHDADMKLVPQLAQSWRWVDPTTLEVKLRHGVKFHSGAVMTADDVVFTFTRLLTKGAIGGKTSPRKGLLGPVTSVEKVDADTVRFKLSAPWPVLPAMLTFQEVVNKAFTEKQGARGMATHEDGTGPYTLDQWRRGESLVLRRFPGYWGGAPGIKPLGKSCTSEVIIKFIPENASRVAALLAGDVDFINELPAHDIRNVEANPNTKVVAVNGTRTFFVALNTSRPPFNDVRVRRAANHALDRKLIIDKLLAGRAVPLQGVLSPSAFGFNPDLPAYGYDVKKAKALLAAAGHKGGIDVTLDTDGPQKDIAEAIASLLTRAGIRTRVAVGEPSQLRVKWAFGGKREGDMRLTSWGNGSLDPTGIFVPTLETGGRGNSAGYSNPEVDKLLTEAGRETDTTKRAALYRKAQVIVHDQAPWIFLWLPQDLYGASKRLTGWAPSSSGWLNLRDACVK